jgi:hypothetical protein
MPRSISYVPTAANIVYAGTPQAMLASSELSNGANQNKFLKNVTGNLTWIALPLPATGNAADDGKQLVYDHATQSFVLRQILPLYDAKGDSQRLWLYEFSASTFVANTSISEAGGKTAFNVSTMYGTTSLADSNRAMQITNGSGGGFLIPNGKPSAYTSNWSVTYMLNSNLTGQPTNTNIQLVTGNNFINNYIYALSNNVNQSYVVVDNDAGAPTAYSSPYGPTISAYLPQNAISIVTFANIDGRFYYYLNGNKLIDVAFANVLSSIGNVSFSGAPSTNSNQFLGLTYGICAMQDATIAKLQKVEGYFKWNSRFTGLTITLDATHPYNATAPTI